jgi:geranylgeranyl diphosphate synthase type I
MTGGLEDSRSVDHDAPTSFAGLDAPTSFAGLVGAVRAAVDAQLTRLLDAAVDAVRPSGPKVVAPIEALRALSLRGGKRLRPVLIAAAHAACGGTRSVSNEAVLLAGAAIELLQTYLLIHDDWMDGDLVRRGGPSVHAMLRATYGSDAEGDAAAILAGDYASAMAQEALASMPLPTDRVAEAARAFARIQRDVIRGQLLDLHGASGAAVEAMHDLKTGSYTVRGPLALGAIVAGGTSDQRAALDRFSAPLGIAFQLRDDLLGTFGDPRATGKPAGNDLRRGKRTALVAALAGDAEGERLMARVFGAPSATEADVASLVARMEASGARARVEARLRDLLGAAERELAAAPLSATGKAWLEGAVKALGERDS